MSAPEAFLLLTLANTTLSTPGSSESGTLSLECITVQIPDASASVDRDVYLILRLNSIETPIDPARIIHRADGSGWRTYSFQGTDADPTELTVTIWPPTPSEPNPVFLEDLETFESILAQYADLRGSPNSVHVTNPISTTPAGGGDVIGSGFPGAHGDLRGQLVVVNEDTGEVVGQFDDGKFKVKEDPKLREKGHENDAVIIEIPEPSDDPDDDANALQMFIRAVPPDQQDWITKSATIVSHAISTTTSLLLTTITTASSYYIANSAPSPHHQVKSAANSAPGSSTGSPVPPPLPPRALVFLTSAKTRKGLASVHAVSGQAVKVSAKTVSLIDSMIRRAMGAKPKRQRQFLSPASTPGGSPPVAGTPPALPRTPSPSASKSHLAPPGYFASPTTGSSFPADKPVLPPRRSTSPVPPPFPPRTSTGIPDGTIHAPQPRLSTKDRVLLSADLILSTIDHSTRQLLDTSTTSIGAVVGHKYGPDAAQSSLLMAGTARNVGLVYVDMRGIGRKALLKRAGKTFVKARVSNNKG